MHLTGVVMNTGRMRQKPTLAMPTTVAFKTILLRENVLLLRPKDEIEKYLLTLHPLYFACI